MRQMRFHAVVFGALAASLLAGHGVAAPRAPSGPRCPSSDELAELSRSVGTGPDSERRAYSYFGDRFGRPASLSQRGNDAQIIYGVSGVSVRVSLRRGAASGVVEITCREGQ